MTTNPGRFKKVYPDSLFLDIVNQLTRTTTNEVSKEIGCSSDLANLRLKKLCDKNLIGGKLNGRFWIWFKLKSTTSEIKSLSDLKSKYAQKHS